MPNQTFKAKYEGGVLVYDAPEALKSLLESLDGQELSITIGKYKKTRTAQQNASLHLLFTQIAEACNEKGFDMRTLIKYGVEIPWSSYTVKNHLWRPLQVVMIGEKSTTRLKTDEIDKVWEVLHKTLVERTKGEVDLAFPSMSSLFEENYGKQN